MSWCRPPAPTRLIEGGLPTEATVAQVLVSKCADYLPLYRQAQIYARQDIALDRSTLADWVGRAAWLLRPVHERLLAIVKGSTKLFADETTAPVPDPVADEPRPGSSSPMRGMIVLGVGPIRPALPLSMLQTEYPGDERNGKAAKNARRCGSSRASYSMMSYAEPSAFHWGPSTATELFTRLINDRAGG